MSLVWLVDGVIRRNPPVAPAVETFSLDAPSLALRRAASDGLTPDGPAVAPPQGPPGSDPWNTPVSEVMTSPVVALHQDERLRQAAVLMGQRGFLHVPVVDDEGSLVGILSDRDLLRHLGEHRRLEWTVEGHAMDVPLGVLMTSPVLAATPGSSLREAARALADCRISALPVIDDAREPVGIVTIADLLAFAARQPELRFWF